MAASRRFPALIHEESYEFENHNTRFAVSWQLFGCHLRLYSKTKGSGACRVPGTLRNGFRIIPGCPHAPLPALRTKWETSVNSVLYTWKRPRATIGRWKGLDSQTNPVKLVWPVAERQGVSPPEPVFQVGE